MKEEVYREYYGKILKESRLFKLSFSEKFLDTLSLHFKEVIFGPGEVIFNQGEANEEKNEIYFVING